MWPLLTHSTLEPLRMNIWTPRHLTEHGAAWRHLAARMLQLMALTTHAQVPHKAETPSGAKPRDAPDGHTNRHASRADAAAQVGAAPSIAGGDGRVWVEEWPGRAPMALGKGSPMSNGGAA